MKYTLLSAPSQKDLETQVMASLKQGWKLQGGVSVSPMERDEYTPGTLLFTQAMTLSPVGAFLQKWGRSATCQRA
jgi:hypothetical protein